MFNAFFQELIAPFTALRSLSLRFKLMFPQFQAVLCGSEWVDSVTGLGCFRPRISQQGELYYATVERKIACDGCVMIETVAHLAPVASLREAKRNARRTVVHFARFDLLTPHH